MPKPDHRSQMARAWLHFHAARKGRGSGVQPRVSTGRSIHAAPSITPSPREGIEDGRPILAGGPLATFSAPRSGLSVTPAVGSGELANNPAHRVRDAQQDWERRVHRSEHDGWVSGKSGNSAPFPAYRAAKVILPSLSRARFAFLPLRVWQRLVGRAAFGPELPLVAPYPDWPGGRLRGW